MIAEPPLAFESVDQIKLGYRRCVCGSDCIFYRIQNKTVEIMTIVGRQDVSRIFK
jgi:toxin ParE1/3/4